MLKRQIDLENCTIRYLEGGEDSSSKSAVLFLHGWALSAEAFRDGLTILSEHYRVIAPDWLGFGQANDPASAWDYDDYAQTLLSFLKAVEIEQVHLVGHSTGGGISIVLAGLAPGMVRSLSLVDSAGIPIGSLANVLFQRLIELPAQTWGTKTSPQHKGMIGAALYNSLFRTKTMSRSLSLPLKVDLRPRLSDLELPCLVVWGENDRTIPLSFGQELWQRIKGAKMVTVEKAHHDWSLLLPEKFATIILEFLDGVEAKE